VTGPFIEPDGPEDREEQLVRDDASRGNVEWLPTYERPGSLVDDDHTWE
jgi:hypothetical protein